ncbi:MAG: hypothetical protein CMJ75_01110 [Planctomycetaceae bacterium]|nr:hypothetical protein [Planctomycetaceae bacterium]
MTYGIWSLVPPLLAIALAMLTRRIVVALAVGVFAGALILAGGNPVLATSRALEAHLWKSLADEQHLRVFTFTLLMGAMIGVVHRSGGMHGVVTLLAPLARNRRGGQFLTWLLGLLVFIDDYANSLLLGNTMRPLTDRLRISREKLAYLVDSTAAPVSGLALISTWVAGEIGYIEEGFRQLSGGVSVDGLSYFVQTIPYRFYVLWSLLMVPLVALLGRDFGPMLAAERRAFAGVVSGVSEPQDGPDLLAGPDSGKPLRWLNAVIPVVVTIVVVVGLLVLTGRSELGDGKEGAYRLLHLIGNGDSYLSLVYGSLSGLIVACGLAWGQRLLTAVEIRQAATQGARVVFPALSILWLAWAVSEITDEKHLGTAVFLGNLLEGALDLRWIPTAVFVIASLVAFSTGTSWGTMLILMPIVIGVTFKMLTDQGLADAEHPLLIAAVGSVLAGAIFGDHCSPISDTTVLSSQASGCHHVEHVRTQLPYALLVAAISILCGTIPVGFGFSVWLTLPVGSLLLIGALAAFGRRVDAA